METAPAGIFLPLAVLLALGLISTDSSSSGNRSNRKLQKLDHFTSFVQTSSSMKFYSHLLLAPPCHLFQQVFPLQTMSPPPKMARFVMLSINAWKKKKNQNAQCTVAAIWWTTVFENENDVEMKVSGGKKLITVSTLSSNKKYLKKAHIRKSYSFSKTLGS